MKCIQLHCFFVIRFSKHTFSLKEKSVMGGGLMVGLVVKSALELLRVIQNCCQGAVENVILIIYTMLKLYLILKQRKISPKLLSLLSCAC